MSHLHVFFQYGQRNFLGHIRVFLCAALSGWSTRVGLNLAAYSELNGAKSLLIPHKRSVLFYACGRQSTTLEEGNDHQ